MENKKEDHITFDISTTKKDVVFQGAFGRLSRVPGTGINLGTTRPGAATCDVPFWYIPVTVLTFSQLVNTLREPKKLSPGTASFRSTDFIGAAASFRRPASTLTPGPHFSPARCWALG
jgi:hypothetical protein